MLPAAVGPGALGGLRWPLISMQPDAGVLFGRELMQPSQPSCSLQPAAPVCLLPTSTPRNYHLETPLSSAPTAAGKQLRGQVATEVQHAAATVAVVPLLGALSMSDVHVRCMCGACAVT